MSRRIKTKTEITNKDLAVQALKQAGIGFEVRGNDSILMTSGELANATIQLKTGTISGDSDFGHTSSKFGLLRQYYSEAQVRYEYQKNGTQIDERTTDKEGNIILQWHMG